MSAIRLDEVYLPGGIRSTHYFNGRILSAEDLQRDQVAERIARERLGLALTDGVVRGLEVLPQAIGGSSKEAPVVTVNAGMAINRRGETLWLQDDVAISLLPPAKGPPATASTTQSSGFNDCLPPQSTVYVAGSGVYLLTIAPRQAREGLATVSGLGNQTAPCNAKSLVDGIVFRLVTVTLSPAELADEAYLRNLVAYKCFFAEGAGLDTVRDPFGPAPAAPADLTEPALAPCEVPLALIHWTYSGGIRWVDTWAVRRPACTATPIDIPWVANARRKTLGQAMLAQFQQQLEEQRSTASFYATAKGSFRYLPPVGWVPLGSAPGATAFNVINFFNGFTVRGPIYIEGSRVDPLLQTSMTVAPIDTQSPTLVWLYQVRENRQPVSGKPNPQPYILFTRGDMDYQGEPRFDVAHIEFANYSLTRKGPGL